MTAFWIVFWIIAGIILLPIAIWTLLITVYGIFALCVTKKEYTKDSGLYRCLMYFATWICMTVGRVKLHTEGFEKLPKDTKFLLVGNHRSNFDPIVTWQVMKKEKLAFISKEENFHKFLFGRIIRRCCFLAIDREDPRKAIETLKKSADLIRRSEVSVGVYPEGTRNKGTGLLPFHNGVFKIAQMANSPLVVVFAENTDKIYKNYFFHRTDVYIKVLKVYSPEEIKKMRSGEIGEEVRKMMEAEIET